MTPHRIRRVRIEQPAKLAEKVRRSTGINSLDGTELCTTMERLATIQEEMARLSKQASSLDGHLLKLMQSNNLDTFRCERRATDEVIVAERTRSKGKTQNVIDPSGFKDLVTEDDFLACITVSVTKAKTILSERELVDIMETTPGKLGDYSVTVKIEK